MNGWLPVLAFHRICDIAGADDPLELCTRPRDLERLLGYLSRHRYRFVSLNTALSTLRHGRRGDEKLVSLTFDDGYRDFYTHAFPLLRRVDARATVFVVTGCIGSVNRWDESYGLPPVPLLTKSEIVELDAGGIEFGSHSVSHRRLTALRKPEQVHEVCASRDALEDLLGHSVRFFCYPHLDWDEPLQALVREAGYLGACGGEQAEHSPYLMHRINVGRSGWLSTLFRTWGWRHALQRSRRLRSLKQSLAGTRAAEKLSEVRR